MPTSGRPSPHTPSPPRRAAGWIWDIGLPTRRGVGHVFSSSHTSVESAERELADYVERTSGAPARRGAAQAQLQARVSAAVLAPQLRRHRTVGRVHRAAGGVGAGAGGAFGRHAERRNAGDARRHGHRRAPLQRLLHLSLGTGHRFPEAALRAEPARRRDFWRDNRTRRDPSPSGCASCWRFGGTSRLRVTICTASRKCFRRRVTSTCSMAWVSGPSRRGSRGARTMPIAPMNTSARRRSSRASCSGGCRRIATSSNTSGKTDCNALENHP